MMCHRPIMFASTASQLLLFKPAQATFHHTIGASVLEKELLMFGLMQFISATSSDEDMPTISSC